MDIRVKTLYCLFTIEVVSKWPDDVVEYFNTFGYRVGYYGIGIIKDLERSL
jgi:hypothetical protein